ncbi:beta-phosphoglucomutase [Sinomicrobium weinanense]|uniref:Beta-phosphoglucomutase n=1 Tax=Sinomicrobium weinanense TaxID=2842200 RepID=A0A926JVM0_9FLAO|nr:beta-phosphoglucomutase [Sinomicrobium weinanense]MBC9798403.1 beta-phosphoglucomutase [Sinomicrobium weinanense]MBU3125100.1 beta-phosphoglucomutase [Sinomicrobium weinanense]
MKGFIFDLDGVIVDTARYHFLAWKKLAEELGVDFTVQDNEKLKGVSRARSLEILLELGEVKATEEEKEKWMQQKNEGYLQYVSRMDEQEVLPGVIPALQFLKANDGRIALGSASRNARLILEKTGIMPLFDTIVDGNDVSKAKPDPEVFVLAAKQLHVEPADCVVFEDSVAGIQAANTAGMASIGIGEADVLEEADRVFPDFTQIDLENLLSRSSPKKNNR